MLAVVVLTYRQPAAVVERCVASVAAGGDADLIVVVDNGGTVGKVDTVGLEAAAGRPVVLVRPETNLGFGGGMNLGIRTATTAGATAVAILNDDTEVTCGWLGTLAVALSDGADIGAVQPKVLFPGSPPSRISSVGVRWRSDGAGIDIGHGEVDVGQYDQQRAIELFTGAAVLLRTDFVEATGGFDEDYFMYYEDIDLSLRGTQLGWRYLCEPAAVVFHVSGATSTADPERRRYWQERNRLWCLGRHASASAVARGLALSAARTVRHPSAMQWRAVVDGCRGLAQRRRVRQ